MSLRYEMDPDSHGEAVFAATVSRVGEEEFVVDSGLGSQLR
jgi:hypothetical protein